MDLQSLQGLLVHRPIVFLHQPRSAVGEAQLQHPLQDQPQLEPHLSEGWIFRSIHLDLALAIPLEDTDGHSAHRGGQKEEILKGVFEGRSSVAVLASAA